MFAGKTSRRQPDVGLEPQQPFVQFGIELLDAALQPGSLDGEAEVPDSHPEKAIV
jgi:hypothetical protein